MKQRHQRVNWNACKCWKANLLYKVGNNIRQRVSNFVDSTLDDVKNLLIYSRRYQADWELKYGVRKNGLLTKTCTKDFGVKNCIAKHMKPNFLSADIEIWFNIIVQLHISRKRENKKEQWNSCLEVIINGKIENHNL